MRLVHLCFPTMAQLLQITPQMSSRVKVQDQWLDMAKVGRQACDNPDLGASGNREMGLASTNATQSPMLTCSMKTKP